MKYKSSGIDGAKPVHFEQISYNVSSEMKNSNPCCHGLIKIARRSKINPRDFDVRSFAGFTTRCKRKHTKLHCYRQMKICMSG